MLPGAGRLEMGQDAQAKGPDGGGIERGVAGMGFDYLAPARGGGEAGSVESAQAEQTGAGDIPLVIHYRVQAGQLDAGSWYLNPDEGSRFSGEAGHFIDVLGFLTRSRPSTVYAAALRPNQGLPDDRDNLSVTITYENGSVGTLQYLTQGGNKLPKEWIEVHGAASTAQLQNFEQVVTFSATQQQKFRGSGIDKGQKAEMAAFVRAVRTASPMPISLDELLDTTLVTLAAEESLKTGRVVSLASLWDVGSDA